MKKLIVDYFKTKMKLRRFLKMVNSHSKSSSFNIDLIDCRSGLRIFSFNLDGVNFMLSRVPTGEFELLADNLKIHQFSQGQLSDIFDTAFMAYIKKRNLVIEKLVSEVIREQGGKCEYYENNRRSVMLLNVFRNIDPRAIDYSEVVRASKLSFKLKEKEISLLKDLDVVSLFIDGKLINEFKDHQRLEFFYSLLDIYKKQNIGDGLIDSILKSA